MLLNETSMMSVYGLLLGVGALISLGKAEASSVARVEDERVIVSVDLSSPEPEISRNIYGQFSEHLGRGIYGGIWVGDNPRIQNTRGIRNDVVAALRRINVPLIRWPGGCFADTYHWKDGIGPRQSREQRNGDSNHFGTHEFLDFAEQVGAEPYISINMGSGSVQEAIDWLEYMTRADDSLLANLRRSNGREKPWKVRYVGLGNEAWGCGGYMRPEYYADKLRQYATFLRSGEKQRFLIASGPLNDGLDFTRVLIKNSSWTYPHSDITYRFIDGISVHYYTSPDGEWVPHKKNRGRATGFQEDKWVSTLRASLRMDEVIQNNKKILDEYDKQKSVALVVDEWGTHYEPDSGTNPFFDFNSNFTQQNSLRDALVTALTFNVFHRHSDRVKIANIAQMVNVLQSVILTADEKMVLTPTYYVFDMYQVFQGATPYRTSVSGPTYSFNANKIPAVDASAARGRDGKIYLALVNVDPRRPAEVVTNLNGIARGRLLTGPAIDSHNTFLKDNVVQPSQISGSNTEGPVRLQLPAKAVAVVVVDEYSPTCRDTPCRKGSAVGRHRPSMELFMEDQRSVAMFARQLVRRTGLSAEGQAALAHVPTPNSRALPRLPSARHRVGSVQP